MARAFASSVLAAAVLGAGFFGPGAGSVARAASPQLLKGPYLTGLSDGAVDLRFELDGASPATVEIAADGDAGAPRVVEDASSAMHVVHVGGLQPARTYTYDVRVGSGAVAGKGQFTTAPRPGADAPARFLVYGDDRSDETAHAALVRDLAATPSDFLVNTGDIVADGGNAADWQSFFRVEAPLIANRALFLAIGNHELYDDQAGATFARYFGYPDASGALEPYGTMRWGNTRLFFLNGMHDWQSGPEREWLDRELALADKEPGLVWRIVVVHHGPWSSGPHGGNAKLLSAHIPELLAAHGVDLVLAGHDHLYERGTGTLKYVISGGGGAPLYPIEHHVAESRKAESAFHFVEIATTEKNLEVVAHRVDGTLIERCGFEKGQPWGCDPKAQKGLAGPLPAPAQAPAAAPSEASGAGRCGCVLPGTGARAGFAAGLLALGVIGMAAFRRRG